jgi:adenosylmethionine-8-amino-7-oxononanoate aminotransferase
MIVRAMSGNSVALCPPLIITQAQIDELVEKLGKALAETLDYATREQLLVA